MGGKFACYLRHAIGQVENISFSGEILLLFGFGLHAYSSKISFLENAFVLFDVCHLPEMNSDIKTFTFCKSMLQRCLILHCLCIVIEYPRT